jgi:hypothetical protein
VSEIIETNSAREDQPDGRHTAEYVARHGEGQVGMYPLGAARRDLTAVGESSGRGDRYSWRAPR